MEAMFFSSPGSIGQEDRRKQKKAHRKKREKDPSRKTGLSWESWLCRTSHAHVFLLPVPPDPFFGQDRIFVPDSFDVAVVNKAFPDKQNLPIIIPDSSNVRNPLPRIGKYF
ncbi:hypothetical protein ABH19_05685 [Leptospirillum sp. Group II 'CF-1']|jgi:hypothetical protein|nr:hypothetical protein ABH19_05685 [Leptospirillum sp. Group II 'CF-1']